jgi:glycosyltransferase involved in cell wall biosynthesis
MSHLLSILIPTLNSRAMYYNRLSSFLNEQIRIHELKDKVKIIPLRNNGEQTIGTLRNILVKQCTSIYSVFIDDDDMIDALYLRDMVNVLETESPDAVGFKGIYTNITRGVSEPFIIRCGEKYEKRGNCYYRPPNHLSPKRNEFYLKVPFPDLAHGEDYGQCMALQRSGLIKSCSFIDKMIYTYLFNPNKKPKT